ncbi:hypothetical protein Ptr902_11930 [Pyrenophora tritici-repentis]|uniref:Uncharacterized protein n=1 Tax=Pyrenophora tritici-repentis TaxID=45151 RepID=A0A5M9L0B2_9PLEO|nr:hypothetical protein PtrV1_09701 [Pyrenophora tritici-repentis]KAF7442845.1 hypothetical protein A1F99_123520 [Pyrenophora tritici-repentis]KAF7568701.1 hypothetical protein PtrM4_133140 [Pyrenophora tritici-repentis]KAI0580512.1 hypothetical protein Alg215_05158 [Pyrenophora tritici-repentis]KAI0587769.1 hypothetical protein Alg130_03682 [Pyrenophora tritici-repentis]
MKATAFVQFTMLVLPALAVVAPPCTWGFGCQCYYQLTDNRCTVRPRGSTWVFFQKCNCPKELKVGQSTYFFDFAECIDIGKVHRRAHCPDGYY